MGSSTVEAQPFHRGAEADLFLSTVDHWKVVVKRRVRKHYRVYALDNQLRKERTVSEVDILHDAKIAGVKVPSVLGIDPEENTFSMTHIYGKVARDCLDQMSSNEASRLFKKLGSLIGSLHKAGIVHGDLTTSNVLVTPIGDPFVVDFGMSHRSVEAEDRGVDLHLLQRSITATHFKDVGSLFEALSVGYAKSTGKKIQESSFAKAREISRRGRYFEIR